MDPVRHPNDITRFFQGLTEHAFQATLGVVDPPLVDYVSVLLVRYLRSDSIASWPGRGRKSGAAVPAVEQLWRAAAATTESLAAEPLDREGFRELGDAALFWTGLYPEAVRRPRGGLAEELTPSVADYRAVGRRAYWLASRLPATDPDEEGRLLARLSHEFDLCVAGLAEVRKSWADSG